MNFLISKMNSLPSKKSDWIIYNHKIYSEAEIIILEPSISFINEADFEFSIFTNDYEVLKIAQQSNKINTIYSNQTSEKSHIIENKYSDDFLSIISNITSDNENQNLNFTLLDYDLSEDENINPRIKEKILDEYFKISKIKDVSIVSLGSKYFNLVFESLKNSSKKKEYEIFDIKNKNIEILYNYIQENTKDIQDKKCFTSITSEGYEWGTIALCQTINKFHSHPVIIFYTENTDINLINENTNDNVFLIKVPVIIIDGGDGIEKRYFNTLNKFMILALTNFETVVYLDGDMIVLNSLNEFINYTGDSILATYTPDRSYSNPAMAVSILAFKPEKKLFEDFIANAIQFGNKGRGDHPYFINFYKNNWDKAEDKFNLSHLPYGKTGIKIPNDTVAIHYHGFKPWERTAGRGSYLANSDIHKLWFENLSHNSLIAFSMWYREKQMLNESDNTFNRYKKTIGI